MLNLSEDIKKLVNDGKNIAITGLMGTGKSTVMKALMKEAADSGHEYSCYDEVITQDEVKVVKNRISSGRATIFTHHYNDKEDLKELFGSRVMDNVVQLVCSNECGVRSVAIQ